MGSPDEGNMKNTSKYIKDLLQMKEELLSEIDGGEEYVGNDQKLSRWIEVVDEAISDLRCLYKIIVDYSTEAQAE